MTRDQIIEARQALVTQLPVTGEILRGSLFERTVRHPSGCTICAGGGGHPLWVLTISYAGGRTRQFSLRREQVDDVRRWLGNYHKLKEALERRPADALAVDVACDLPPPFGLLQVAETLGLGPLHPESTSPLAMVEALLAELPPEWTSTAAAQSAHRASAEWEQKYETVATWFEAGRAIEHLLRPL